MPNYENPVVMNIREKLGPFEYDSQKINYRDGVTRQRRGQMTLENGARYEGDWNVSDNTRDG